MVEANVKIIEEFERPHFITLFLKPEGLVIFM